MSGINYELTLYHSPYHDTLLEELNSLIKQKKKIYQNIYSEAEFNKKLSFEERAILKHLIAKEDSILFELIKHKGWNRPNQSTTYSENEIDDSVNLDTHRFGY